MEEQCGCSNVAERNGVLSSNTGPRSALNPHTPDHGHYRQYGAPSAEASDALVVYHHYRLAHLERCKAAVDAGPLTTSTRPHAGSAPAPHYGSQQAHGDGWRATFVHSLTGDRTTVRAPFLVVAGAPLRCCAIQHLHLHPTPSGADGDCEIDQNQLSAPVRLLHAGVASKAVVTTACSVRILGTGQDAHDVASAVALLRRGRTVALQQAAADACDGSAREEQHLHIDGVKLLSSARRRALAASLQPHYAAPEPGPLAKALRAPSKRRFWALVKDKLAVGSGSGGGSVSSSSSSSGGEHLVLWAPSLHDPRFMPFLSAPLRQALLGGAGGDGDLTLYRGMVHPDVPGLAFVGLEAHAGSNLLLLELQAQWLAAHLAGQLALPSAAAMRADVAAQRAWRSGALAHPLMSAGGSLARRHEQWAMEQLRGDLQSFSPAIKPIRQDAAPAPAVRPLASPFVVVPLSSDGVGASVDRDAAAGRGSSAPWHPPSNSTLSAQYGSGMAHTATEASMGRHVGARLHAHSAMGGPEDVVVGLAIKAGETATAESVTGPPAARLPPSALSAAAQQFFITRYRTSNSHGLVAASAPTSPRRLDQGAGVAGRRAASRPVSSRLRHPVGRAGSETEEAEEAAGCCATKQVTQVAQASQSLSAVGAGWLVSAALRHSQSGPLHVAQQPVAAVGPARRIPRRSITTGTIGTNMSRALTAVAAAVAASVSVRAAGVVRSGAMEPITGPPVLTAALAVSTWRDRRSTTCVPDEGDQTPDNLSGRRRAAARRGASLSSIGDLRITKGGGSRALASTTRLGRRAAAGATPSAFGRATACESPLCTGLGRMAAASGLPLEVLMDIVTEQHQHRHSPAQLASPQPQRSPLLPRPGNSPFAMPGAAPTSGLMEPRRSPASSSNRARRTPQRASFEIGPSGHAASGIAAAPVATMAGAVDSSASRLVVCTPLSDGESDADASVCGGARRKPIAAQGGSPPPLQSPLTLPMRMSLQGSDRLAEMDGAACPGHASGQAHSLPRRGMSQRFGVTAAHVSGGLLGLSLSAVRQHSKTASPPSSAARSRRGMSSWLLPGTGGGGTGGATAAASGWGREQPQQHLATELPMPSTLQANGMVPGDAGMVSALPTAGPFHTGSFSVGGSRLYDGDPSSAGGGDALQELEEQMRALRTHLQNPALFPFPSIGLGPASVASSRSSRTPSLIAASGDCASTSAGKGLNMTAGYISPSKPRRSVPKHRSSAPNLVLLEVGAADRKTDLWTCIPEESESTASRSIAGGFLAWRRSLRPRGGSNSLAAVEATAEELAGSPEPQRSLTGSLERPLRTSRSSLHASNQVLSLLERTRSSAVAAAAALASASRRLHRLASVGTARQPGGEGQLQQTANALCASPPQHSFPLCAASINSHDIIDHLPALPSPLSAHKCSISAITSAVEADSSSTCLPARFGGVKGFGSAAAVTLTQKLGMRTSGDGSVHGSSAAIAMGTSPLGRPRAMGPARAVGCSAATAPIAGASMASPTRSAMLMAASSSYGLTDPLAHLVLPSTTTMKHSHSLLSKQLSSLASSPSQYQQSPSGAHQPPPIRVLPSSTASSAAAANTPFGRCSASEVITSPRGSSHDGTARLPSRSMSGHPGDAHTLPSKSRGGTAAAPSAVTVTPEERRTSSSRHMSLRRHISSALLVLHRAATGAVGSAKGGAASSRESAGTGLFAEACQNAALPYSRRIPRSLSRGGINSGSMGDIITHSKAPPCGAYNAALALRFMPPDNGSREAAMPLSMPLPLQLPPQHEAQHSERPAWVTVNTVDATAGSAPGLLAARRSQDLALPAPAMAHGALLPSRSAASATAVPQLAAMHGSSAQQPSMHSRFSIVSVTGLASRQHVRASAPPRLGYTCGPAVDVETQATRLPCLTGRVTQSAAGDHATADAGAVTAVSSGPGEASAAGLAAPLAVLQEVTVEADVDDALLPRSTSNILPSAISVAEALDFVVSATPDQRSGGASGHISSGGRGAAGVMFPNAAVGVAAQLALRQTRFPQYGPPHCQDVVDVDELEVTVGPVGASMLSAGAFGVAHAPSVPVSPPRHPQLEFVLPPPSQAQREALRRTRGGSDASLGGGSVTLHLPSVRGGVVADLLAAGSTARRSMVPARVAGVGDGSDHDEHGLEEEEEDIFGLSHLLRPLRRTSPAGQLVANMADQHAVSVPLPQRAPQVPASCSSRSNELGLSSNCAIPLAPAQLKSRPFPMQLSPSDLPLQAPVPVNNITDEFELLDPEADTANTSLEDRLSPVGSCARLTPGTSPFRSAYASSHRLSLAPRCPATIVGLADSLISTAYAHGSCAGGPPSAGWGGAPGRHSMNTSAMLLSSVHSASFGHGGASHGGVAAGGSGASMASRMLSSFRKMGSMVRMPPSAAPQQPVVVPPRRSVTSLTKCPGGRGSIGGVLPLAVSHLAALHVLAPSNARDSHVGSQPGRGRDGVASDACAVLSQNPSQRSSGGSGVGSGRGSGQAIASPGGSAGSPAASVPASRRTLVGGGTSMLRHKPAHSHLQHGLRSGPRTSSPNLQDMHDDLLEAARWSAAQRQAREMKRQLAQRAPARDRLSMVGAAAAVPADSHQGQQHHQHHENHQDSSRALAAGAAAPSSQRPQLSEPLPSPVLSPLYSPHSSRAPSPLLLQTHAQPNGSQHLPLNWFARHSLKVKTSSADAQQGTSVGVTALAASSGGGRAFRRSCTSPRSPLSPAKREHSRMRNMALAEDSGPSSPLRSGSAHSLTALGGSSHALHAVKSGEVSLSTAARVGGRFARGSSISGPGGLGPHVLSVEGVDASAKVAMLAAVGTAETNQTHSGQQGQAWLDAAAIGISGASEHPHSIQGAPSSCAESGVLLEAAVMEAGVRRGGPAWEVIQASRARQEQMVNQVSAWLREALAKKAAAAAAAAAAAQIAPVTNER